MVEAAAINSLQHCCLPLEGFFSSMPVTWLYVLALENTTSCVMTCRWAANHDQFERQPASLQLMIYVWDYFICDCDIRSDGEARAHVYRLLDWLTRWVMYMQLVVGLSSTWDPCHYGIPSVASLIPEADNNMPIYIGIMCYLSVRNKWTRRWDWLVFIVNTV